MKKVMYEKLYFLLVMFFLLTGCNSGVTIEGRLIDALSNKPLDGISIVVEGLRTIKTDENGYFKIKRLQSFEEYNFNIQPDNYTSVTLQIRNNENKKQIEAGTLLVIPQLPSSGVFTYSNGKYYQIPEKQAFRYYLEYGEPGKEPLYIPSSGADRLAAWFLKNESISSLPQIPQGTPLVIWQSGGYNGIAPLFQQKSRTITCSSMGSISQATIPYGWYLGLKDIVINENNNRWYASLNYTIIKWSFKELQSTNGQNFSIISTNFELGKYAFINSEMDWDPNSSYAIVNGVRPEITSSVSVFEIIRK